MCALHPQIPLTSFPTVLCISLALSVLAPPSYAVSLPHFHLCGLRFSKSQNLTSCDQVPISSVSGAKPKVPI